MRKLIAPLFIVLLLFALSINSCKKKKTTTSTSKTFIPTCNSTPSFSATVKPLFQNACVGCHSNYSTYTQISASASPIRTAIIDGSMPKGSTLSDNDKNNIVCWIDAGKPNN